MSRDRMSPEWDRYLNPKPIPTKCLVCGQIFEGYNGVPWGVCSSQVCQETALERAEHGEGPKP